VSDGSSRNPGTAGFLLAHIAREFEDWPELDDYSIWSRTGLEKIKARLRRRVERAMAAVPYFESCTLTGLLLGETSRGQVGLIVHTGDSLLYHYRPETGVRAISKTNFWLAGRSKRLYQLEQIEIPAGSVLFLATDGLADLVFPAGFGREEVLGLCLGTGEVEDVSDRLLERYDHRVKLADDLSVVALRPERVQPCSTRIILGRVDLEEAGFNPVECSGPQCRLILRDSIR